MAIKIEDLLKNKGILEEKMSEKKEDLTIKSLKTSGIGDGKVVIKSLKMDRVQDIFRMSDNDLYKSSVIACYEGIIEPNLKDKELQKGLGCGTNPHGIVEELFDPSEIKAISDKISLLSGIGKNANEVIEEIKN